MSNNNNDKISISPANRNLGGDLSRSNEGSPRPPSNTSSKRGREQEVNEEEDLLKRMEKVNAVGTVQEERLSCWQRFTNPCRNYIKVNKDKEFIKSAKFKEHYYMKDG